MKHPALTIRAVRTRAVNVPMNRPLGTSATRMEMAPFVLVDLDTEEGVPGRAHVFCYRDIAAPLIRRVIAEMGEALTGTVANPAEIGRLGRSRFALLGTPGVVGMALSALDVACWDALARAADLPLGRYLGGTAATVVAYNSNGLGLISPDSLADEARELLAPGFEAVKIRLGRDDAREDLRAIRAVRDAIPSESALMADYNQALSVDEALERCSSLDDEGLEWFEEPVAHDDLIGCAQIAAAIDTPIQAGENFTGPATLASAIELGTQDYVMIDLMRIGGVSGWLQASKLAEKAGLPLSSHLYPEVSAHLLAAAPTAHWLEYVDWAEPILETGIAVAAGQASVPAVAGTSVIWDEAAIRQFSFD
jgi:mandelate racemase